MWVAYCPFQRTRFYFYNVLFYWVLVGLERKREFLRQKTRLNHVKNEKKRKCFQVVLTHIRPNVVCIGIDPESIANHFKAKLTLLYSMTVFYLLNCWHIFNIKPVYKVKIQGQFCHRQQQTTRNFIICLYGAYHTKSDVR